MLLAARPRKLTLKDVIFHPLTMSGTPLVHLMVTVAHSVFLPPNASANSIRRF